jgi:hypothetical protein
MSHHGPVRAVPRQRRVGGLGVAAMVLVGVVVVLDIALTWTTWHAYWLVEDYIAGVAGVTEADVNSADNLGLLVYVVYLVGFVAAGIVFVTWLWRARVNAEALVPAPHRRGRGWVVGSWICPVVNLWFPYMIVDDVYRASRPTSSYDVHDLRVVPGSHLLGLWWALWLASMVLGQIASIIWENTQTVESLRATGIVDVLESATALGAAVSIIMIVRQINTWQDRRAAQTAAEPR